jgi:hypothetical protein
VAFANGDDLLDVLVELALRAVEAVALLAAELELPAGLERDCGPRAAESDDASTGDQP